MPKSPDSSTNMLSSLIIYTPFKENGGEHPRRRWTRVRRPAHLIRLYYTIHPKKMQYPLSKKHFISPAGFSPIISICANKGFYTQAIIKNYVLIFQMSYTVRKNEYRTVILCPCDILLWRSNFIVRMGFILLTI